MSKENLIQTILNQSWKQFRMFEMLYFTDWNYWPLSVNCYQHVNNLLSDVLI